ncbi:MAG: phosphoenolpyruvate synthase [Gammaproteobacteria bacterium]|nr:phosphoenolpyruvate synthase [Gammaproteobacteria bacterium]
MMRYIRWLKEITIDDIEQVGGKNASLGEMTRHLSSQGINVPQGFATTAEAYFHFLKANDLEEKIYTALNSVDHEDLKSLAKVGKSIREMLIAADFSQDFIDEIRSAYEQLQSESNALSFAVRSSATAEDLPTASFAGQQETYLNVAGFDEILLAMKKVFASLFTDRAICYRVDKDFSHDGVALSVCVQQMVRSDKGCSGIVFTLDTESGFDQVMLVTAAPGLGEAVVQGLVVPDEYYLFKPTLQQGKDPVIRRTLGHKRSKIIYNDDAKLGEESIKQVETSEQERRSFTINDEDLHYIGEAAVKIEAHYGKPMDIEWAKDGISGEILIVQARPETVKSQQTQMEMERYRIKGRGKRLVEGRSVGEKICAGKVRLLNSVDQIADFQPGEVLVTEITDPDWEPIMKRATAIVTNRGGRTCHAAIVARELGIPAVVGCGNATELLQEGQEVTVSCAEGSYGFVYEGIVDYECDRFAIDKMPELPVKIMLNVGNPDKAFRNQMLPNCGVGLARMEFIIANRIGIHPNACLGYEQLDEATKAEIYQRIAGYDDPVHFYIEKLKEGIATITAAFYPKMVIVRTSDFKSNEYANLVGGRQFEPNEENPMLGFRGAVRYTSEQFAESFKLECRALRAVREELGLTNLAVMIPFVRTLEEADRVFEIMAECGLERGKAGLKVMMMCELPSNVVLAEEFLQRFDGFSIGSNDLTQLTLGLDRDSEMLAHLFDERNLAVKAMLKQAITMCHRHDKYVGICGQGPSDYPDLAEWLLEQGIDSMSLNSDSVLTTWFDLAKMAKTKVENDDA